jgi:hypothetical protein
MDFETRAELVETRNALSDLVSGHMLCLTSAS